jgi:hypothetical protein
MKYKDMDFEAQGITERSRKACGIATLRAQPLQELGVAEVR